MGGWTAASAYSAPWARPSHTAVTATASKETDSGKLPPVTPSSCIATEAVNRQPCRAKNEAKDCYLDACQGELVLQGLCGSLWEPAEESVHLPLARSSLPHRSPRVLAICGAAWATLTRSASRWPARPVGPAGNRPRKACQRVSPDRSRSNVTPCTAGAAKSSYLQSQGTEAQQSNRLLQIYIYWSSQVKGLSASPYLVL